MPLRHMRWGTHYGGGIVLYPGMGVRMWIAVDLDNTFADYTGVLRAWVQEHMMVDGCSLADPVAYSFMDSGWPFNSPAAMMEAHRRAVRDGLYLAEQPYPHAVDTIRRLAVQGHDLVFAAARDDDPYGVQTSAWLDEWLPGGRPPVVFVQDKTLLDVDLLVDDKPGMIRAAVAHGMGVAHPAHPYCRDEPGSVFHDWAELPGIVARMAGEIGTGGVSV